jgi:putative transposase
LVTAATVHDTRGLAPLLERAAAAGWNLQRVKVDGIYIGPTVEQASASHRVEVQVSQRDPGTKRFEPLPIRWRTEATFGTLSNRHRRLTRHPNKALPLQRTSPLRISA